MNHRHETSFQMGGRQSITGRSWDWTSSPIKSGKDSLLNCCINCNPPQINVSYVIYLITPVIRRWASSCWWVPKSLLLDVSSSDPLPPWTNIFYEWSLMLYVTLENNLTFPVYLFSVLTNANFQLSDGDNSLIHIYSCFFLRIILIYRDTFCLWKDQRLMWWWGQLS